MVSVFFLFSASVSSILILGGLASVSSRLIVEGSATEVLGSFDSWLASDIMFIASAEEFEKCVECCRFWKELRWAERKERLASALVPNRK
ncbi:hypothetical protein IWX48DRAFT_624214 [Phyllosticta citricarpa]